MSLQLIAGPHGSGYAELLLSRYVESLPYSPVLIVPTALHARLIRERLLDEYGALAAGTVETFGSFARELYRRTDNSRRVLSKVALGLLVEEVKNSGFPHLSSIRPAASAAGFTPALLNFLLELRRCGLSAANLRSAVRAGGPYPGHMSDILTLLTAYEEGLDRLSAIDQEGAAWTAAERILDRPGRLPPIFVLGFADFAPAEMRLIEALAKKSSVQAALPYDPSDSRLNYPKKTYDLLNRLSEQSVFSRLPSGVVGVAERCSLLNAGGRRAEVELTSALLADILTEQPPQAPIGVVCRSLGPYRAALKSVFNEFGLPWELVASEPISHSPFGRAFMAVLRLLVQSGYSVELSDMVTYLSSPYSGASVEMVDEFDHAARRRGLTKGRSLRALFSDYITRGLSCAMGEWLAVDPITPEQAIPLLSQLLGSMWTASSGSRISRDDAEAVSSLRTTLDELAELPRSVVSNLTPAGLRELVSGASLPLHAPGRHVQIVVTDAPTCGAFDSFSHIFILGLNQGEFPLLSADNAFLDDLARRALNSVAHVDLPLSDRRQEHEYYLFRQALDRGQGKVFLSSRYCDDDGGKETESFFLEEIKTESLASGQPLPLVTRRLDDMTFPLGFAHSKRELLKTLALRPSDEEYNKVAKAAGLAEDIAQARTAIERSEPALSQPEVIESLCSRREFSATEIEKYLACPFRWFLDQVLKPARFEPESQALIVGQLAHTVLSRLLRDYQGEPPRAARAVGVYADEAIASIAGDVDPTDREALKGRVVRLLENFVSVELKRLIQNPAFQPILLEASFGDSAETLVEISDRVFIKGRIDRVDVDSEGNAFVIDYKSGQSPAGELDDVDKTGLIQNLLYCLAVPHLLEARPIGCGYFYLGDTKWKAVFISEFEASLGLSKTALEKAAFHALLESARDRVLVIVESIRSGNIRLSPTERNCRTCPKEICGIARRHR